MLYVSALTGTVFSGQVKGNVCVGRRTDVTSNVMGLIVELGKYHGGEFHIRENGVVNYLVTVQKVEPLDVEKDQ